MNKMKTNILFRYLVCSLFLLTCIWCLSTSCQEQEGFDVFSDVTMHVKLPDNKPYTRLVFSATSSNWILNHNSLENFLSVSEEKPFVVQGKSFHMRLLRGYYEIFINGTVFYPDGSSRQIVLPLQGEKGQGAVLYELMDDKQEITLKFNFK